MITITFQVGSEVEGIQIDNEMREYIWANMSDAEFAAGLRDFFRDQLATKVRARIQGDVSNQVQQYIEDHTTNAS